MGKDRTLRRRGRWAVIAVLDDGRTLTGQNKPPFPRTHVKAPEDLPFRARQRRAAEDERRAEDRIVRAVLGVNVR